MEEFGSHKERKVRKGLELKINLQSRLGDSFQGWNGEACLFHRRDERIDVRNAVEENREGEDSVRRKVLRGARSEGYEIPRNLQTDRHLCRLARKGQLRKGEGCLSLRLIALMTIYFE